MLSFEITKGSPNFILLSQICLGFFWGFLHFCENCEIVIVCIKKNMPIEIMVNHLGEYFWLRF